MENLREYLFEAASQRASMVSSESGTARDRFIKETFGIARPLTGSGSTVDQIYNLIEKAKETGRTFVKSSMEKHDYINEYESFERDDIVRSSLKTTDRFSCGTHPLDIAYKIIESALLSASRRTKSFKRNSDLINKYVQENHSSFSAVNSSKHSKADVYDLVYSIYQFNCNSGKKIVDRDPINEVVQRIYGSGRFLTDPTKTMADWMKLLDNAIGPRTINQAMDSINELVAKEFGISRISDENSMEKGKKADQSTQSFKSEKKVQAAAAGKTNFDPEEFMTAFTVKLRYLIASTFPSMRSAFMARHEKDLKKYNLPEFS